ncbi:molybdopterin biosynthesis protein MoeB [Roseovarius sp. THAF9]|uniref:rhodanese-like domain-containing protein n=1 Tax=Roseovarius sp. THAF9 TaxID=2587847 RepID=UPI00126861D5|nr:rhodanese-like domain-containing protein [Roseovarius sp. THAF9]QFT94876.1 molybdopterin biosynthesis protein MoeB [Roseovarius sp. THAF9]
MTGKPASRLSRRALLGAGMGIAAAAGVGWAVWSRPQFDGAALSVRDAFEAAKAGDIILVDIRRPDEWARTGIGQGAHPIDMRHAGFIAELDALTGARKDVPIALICARGVRSARLSIALTEAGYTRVINVPEGMLGSDVGQGWIETGLPVTAYDS